jgi:hypothetical protein
LIPAGPQPGEPVPVRSRFAAKGIGIGAATCPANRAEPLEAPPAASALPVGSERGRARGEGSGASSALLAT